MLFALRAMATRSWGVSPSPNSCRKTLRGLYSIGSGVCSSRNESVVKAPPLPAATCTVVSEASSSDGNGQSLEINLAISWSSVVAMLLPTGSVALSHVAGLRTCTEPAAAAFSMLPKEVVYFLNGSSGELISFSLKLAPDPLGVQRSCAGPNLVLNMIAP